MSKLSSFEVPIMGGVAVVRSGSAMLLAIVVLASVAKAQSLRLVPSQYPTIQGALNAAVSGDRIEVSPGTYVEQIDFLGKAVELVAVGGWEVTMISGGNLPGRVVSFINGESSGAVIRGFRISYALLTVPGLPSTGGIECIGSSPIIRKCVIRDNSTRSPAGGGISILGGAPLIEDCYVHDNICLPNGGIGGGNGGGIAVDGGANVVIRRTAIVDNLVSGYGGGIDIRGASTATIESCRISANRANGDGGGYGAGLSVSVAGFGFGIGNPPSSAVVTSTLIDSNVNMGFGPIGGGVYSLSGDLTLVNCTIAHNLVIDYDTAGAGPGIGAYSPLTSTFGTIELYNTIVWGNFSIHSSFLTYVTNQPQIPSIATLAYCCIEGITPTGTNIALDPLFVSPFDYRLSAASPCRDTGSIYAPYIAAADDTLDPRIIGPSIDRGADEYPPAVLGSTGSPLDGNIGASSGLLTNILFLNGSTGNSQRRKTVPLGAPLTLTITPPATWGPTAYALLAQTTTSHAIPVSPFQTGILAMIPPHQGPPNEAVVLASSLSLPGATLPVTFTSPGLSIPGELLIQAVVIDPQGLMLTTNGIDLTIQ